MTAPASDTVNTPITAPNLPGTLANGVSPTGTIDFFVIKSASTPTTCTGGTQVGTAVNVGSGNGVYDPSTSYTPTTTGDYFWYATYSGDTNNNSATSSCSAMPKRLWEIHTPRHLRRQWQHRRVRSG